MPAPIKKSLSPYQMPTPELLWGEDGAPFSTEFDDIYFSRDDGLAETEYVFLTQNRLAERWRALDSQQPGVFVIGETGFGTGLNFFSAWRLWQQTAPASWRLHFISLEKFPLDHRQLQRALQQWPQFAAHSALLLDNYPARVPGQHLLQLTGNITLQLLFDDAIAGLDALNDSAALEFTNRFIIDAWFLDGFAPARNPSMWSDELFAQIGRLSNHGTTFATFTVAGSVKRGLQKAGFHIEKIAGFGTKRQMLRGEFSAAPTAEKTALNTDTSHKKTAARAADYWAYPPPSPARQPIVVIGGGLAGTSTARALAERGWPVTLLEQHAALASAASGNSAGVLYTKLSPQDGTLNRFTLASYLYALRFYRHLLATNELPINKAFGEFCGVLQLSDDNDDSNEKWLQLREVFSGHDDWVQFVDARRASELALCSVAQTAIWFPRAGWLAPATICATLAQHPLIETRLDCTVQNIERVDSSWRVDTSRGVLHAGIVIIATAHDAQKFAPTAALPLKSIRGQTTQLPASWLRQHPATVICHDGYLTPTATGLDIGATFDLRDDEPTLRAIDHHRNVQLLTKALPQLLAAQMSELSEADDVYQELSGRVGFRCTTPDYLPIIGAVADGDTLRARCAALAHNANARLTEAGAYLPGLYINVGHGSRGLTSTPLCAELLASFITGTPRPLPRDLQQALSPARFLVRDIVRGRHPDTTQSAS
jgi:tRNA 5-methylaminomethyl-2-thiouridine biosynthesis bifunctional protein